MDELHEWIVADLLAGKSRVEVARWYEIPRPAVDRIARAAANPERSEEERAILLRPRTPQEQFERFVSRVDVRDDGCWLWTGSLTNQGYGQLNGYWPNGDARGLLAHRVAWYLWNGEIPFGYTLDHLCHTNDPTCFAAAECHHRRCVNPDHLEIVTPSENVRRGHRGFQGERETCKHGHPWVENLVIAYTPSGRPLRRCRLCLADHQRAYAERRKGNRPSRAKGARLD